MGTTEQTCNAVRDSLAPVIAGLGLSLYDVEFQGAGKARTLRVTVEKDGGVDLDAITDVTHAVSPVLDAEPSLSGSYLLEVSSPGLERSLRTPVHFAGARRRDGVGEVPHRGRHAARARRARRLRRRPTVVVEVDDGRRRDRIRRHHPGAHRFRVGRAGRGSSKPARAAEGSAQRAKKGARA